MANAVTAVGTVENLSESQQKALDAMRSGASIVQAAEKAGVNRATIYRWLERDPKFRATYNAWQNELAESARARVLILTDKAVRVMEAALDQGDRRAAALILKYTGSLRRHQPQATEERVLAVQMDMGRRRQEIAAVTGLIHQILKSAGMPLAEREAYISQHGIPPLGDSNAGDASPQVLVAGIEKQRILDHVKGAQRLIRRAGIEDESGAAEDDEIDEADAAGNPLELMEQLSAGMENADAAQRATA